MIKLFPFLLLRNTTITTPMSKASWTDKSPWKKDHWTIIDKNRDIPFMNTINIKPLFSPDGEEYIIGEFKDLLPL
jgi:hypothetical protein